MPLRQTTHFLFSSVAVIMANDGLIDRAGAMKDLDTELLFGTIPS